MDGHQPRLNLHIEPSGPIEVATLTAALGSLARQYEKFATEEGFVGRSSDARLMVSSVSHGSIDISFLPEITAAGMAMLPIIDKLQLVEKFAKRLKWLIDVFGKGAEKGKTEITVKDCDDATNIVNPIAQSGGAQTINTINGGMTINVLSINAAEARSIVEGAARHRSTLQFPSAATQRQRVAMIWSRLDRDEAKTEGTRSPDRGTIPEIDMRSHPILFTDDMSYIKREMIDDEKNPYQNTYFVDVDIVVVNERIVAYRIVGYHGKEAL